jgi:hypothetical protein
MSDLEVAESVLAIPMAYNSQQTNPSKYQKRQVVNLYPSQNTPLDSGKGGSMIYRFLVPSEGFLDSNASALSLEAYIYNGTDRNTQSAISAGDTVYFTSYTDTWVNRITILTSTGIRIEEIIDANVLAMIMKREMEPTFTNAFGRQALAFWDSANVAHSTNMTLTLAQKQFYSTNQTSGTSNPNRFILPLYQSGFLHSFNYLPLKAMAQGQSNAFQIEVQFGNPSDVIIAYGSTGSPSTPTEGTATTGTYNYVIQSCYYLMNIVNDNEKEAEIMEIIKTTPLILSYQTHNHFGTTLQNTGSTNQTTLSVSEYQESVSEIKFVFRNSTRVGNKTYNSAQFANPSLGQVQLQIGNYYVPSQPTPCGKSTVSGNNYIPLLAEQSLNNSICSQKWGKKWRSFQPASIQTVSSHALNSLDYTDLAIYFNLRVFEDDAVGDSLYNQYTSGINTRSNPVPLQFIFTNLFNLTNLGNTTFEGGIPSTYQIDSFTTYRSNLVIQRGENYVIS